MSRRVLVTGAAGFIGGRLVAGLAARGWSVTVNDVRPPQSAVARYGPVTVADVRDGALLDRIKAGDFAAVVHQAAISDTLADDWAELADVNRDATLRLGEACLTGGATFIYASSFSVYGRIHVRRGVRESDLGDTDVCTGPLNLYARSKMETDHAMTDLSMRGLRWAGLRYTNVFGPAEEQSRASSIISQIVIAAAHRRTIPLFGDTLSAARDYVPVGRVTEAVDRLLRADVQPACYNLGAGHAVTFGTLLEWCSDWAAADGVDVRLVPNPIPDRYQYWTCADLTALGRALPGLGTLDTEQVRAEAEQLYERARGELSDRSGSTGPAAVAVSPK